MTVLKRVVDIKCVCTVDITILLSSYVDEIFVLSMYF